MRAPIRVLALAVLLLTSFSTSFGPSPTSASEKPANPCDPDTIAALLKDQQTAQQAGIKPAPDESASAAPATMPGLLFSDDFEATANLERWRGSGTLTVEEGGAASGKFAARGTGTPQDTGTFARQTLSDGQNTVNYQLRFKVLSQGLNPVGLVALRGINDRRLFTVTIGLNGSLGYTNDLSGVRESSDFVPVQNTWYLLQTSLTVNLQAKTVTSLVWIDQQPIYALWHTEQITPGDLLDLNDVRNVEKGVIGIVQLGDSSGGRIYDVMFDDVIVANRYIESWYKPANVPGSVIIKTYPRVEGAVFQVEGRSFPTDREGKAKIDVERMSYDLRDRITIADQPLTVGDYAGAYPRVTRWFDWNSTQNTVPTAAIGLWYPVKWSFTRQDGNVVPPDQVTSLTFKSSVGTRFTFVAAEHGQAHLLQGSRVVPTPQGPDSKPVYYTIESACVAGSSVVIRAQEQYKPAETQDWLVNMLFYSATISSKDAFYGYSIGSHVSLTFPDGTSKQYSLDKDGTLHIPALPRGDYEMSVVGPGYSPPRPVAITRDQEVELEMVSYVDMATAVLILGLAALGLLLVGRPVLYRAPKAWIRNGFRRKGGNRVSHRAGP
jgi:hypothetical protein